LIIAADHPARGILAVGDRPMAMASRVDLLDRILVALGRPGVDGILGTADIVEDLLLLGALDNKVVLGSVNRGGLPGSAFEIDDRLTGYTAGAIAAAGLDGGKMLLRIDPPDPATAPTLHACAGAAERPRAGQTRRSPAGGTRSPCRTCADWWSGAICSTRPTMTWRPPWCRGRRAVIGGPRA